MSRTGQSGARSRRTANRNPGRRPAPTPSKIKRGEMFINECPICSRQDMSASTTSADCGSGDARHVKAREAAERAAEAESDERDRRTWRRRRR